jgi:hypothetical protein
MKLMHRLDHNEGTNMRVVFDDESSWPFTWYFRDYTNYGFLRGEAGSVDPTSLDGARVVVVGNKKAGDVRRILGDRYYEFQYIRLWWPMQEYFNLNYDRVANIFGTDLDSRFFRDGLFDIWWDRDYSTYAQAMCIEGKLYRCDEEEKWGQTPEEQRQFRKSCELAVVNECRNDTRFEVSQWPVSDRLYFFVDKQLAAQVWDAGIGSSTVTFANRPIRRRCVPGRRCRSDHRRSGGYDAARHRRWARWKPVYRGREPQPHSGAGPGGQCRAHDRRSCRE